MKHIFIILLLCILGFSLRIYKLTGIPNSISADEASFAYNAYSILKTGKDEFGHKLPLYFQSFDDYKNPLLGYLLIPFIKLGGLNDETIRIPSVLLGTSVIPLFYLLSVKLLKNKRIALLATFFAAISPWLIQYSRVAIDMELSLFSTLLGIYIFLKGFDNKIYYPISAVILGLAFYSYHSVKVFIPFFIFLLIVVNKKINKMTLFSALIFFIMLSPYINLLLSTNIELRPYALSVFSNKEDYINDSKLLLTDKVENFTQGQFIHNRRFTSLNQALNGYLKIISPDILFSTSKFNQISLTRLFYIWQFPLIIFGLLYLWRNRYASIFIITWLFLGYLPGGLTILPVFDRRIFLNAFPLIFLAALGLTRVIRISIAKDKFIHNLSNFLIIIIVTFSFYVFLHNYFVHGRNEVVFLWSNGMKELVNEVKKEKVNYKSVVISLKLNQPLTFFLYYEKYSPEKYLLEGGTQSGGYLFEGNKFDKYSLKMIGNSDLAQNTLYVLNSDEKYPCMKKISEVNMSDSKPLAYLAVYDPINQGCME